MTDTKSADLAAIPNRCPDLLKDLEYPTLRDARLVRGWPKDIRSNVAERLEEAFGPLYEGTDTWKIPLSRDARSNRSGRKSEIYKLAIALGLTWQEMTRFSCCTARAITPTTRWMWPFTSCTTTAPLTTGSSPGRTSWRCSRSTS